MAVDGGPLGVGRERAVWMFSFEFVNDHWPVRMPPPETSIDGLRPVIAAWLHDAGLALDRRRDCGVRPNSPLRQASPLSSLAGKGLHEAVIVRS